MIGFLFLFDWALRGAVLALISEAAIRLLRIRDVSTRSAMSVAVLVATLSLPVCTLLIPAAFHTTATPVAASYAPAAASSGYSAWTLALGVYCIVAIVFLLRSVVGVYFTYRVTRRAVALDIPGVYACDSVTVPVAVGLLKPAILLPACWREWTEATLIAVLAHEQSHIVRHDTRIQFLSSLHRAILWFSPVSWWLDARIARLAEDASDDRALSVADPVSYAETLLHFVQQAPRRVLWSGVSMARTLKAERRIDRILSGHLPSRGLRPAALAAIILIALPITYLAAATREDAPPPPAAPPAEAPQAPPAPARAPRAPMARPAKPSPVPPPPPPAIADEELLERTGGELAGAIAGGIVGGIDGGVAGGVLAGIPGDSRVFDTAIRSLEQQVERLTQMIESLRIQQELLNIVPDREFPPPPAAARKMEQLERELHRLRAPLPPAPPARLP